MKELNKNLHAFKSLPDRVIWTSFLETSKLVKEADRQGEKIVHKSYAS
jgi:hypothetical protein